MITLYELHWSHYCEKIRLMLDVVGLPWRAVAVSPFSKREIKAAMRGQAAPAHLYGYTVPTLADDATGRVVMDSTPILRYLCETYPQARALLPQDAHDAAAVDAMLLEFDTYLSLPARRVGYTQVILECPDVLADLFLSRFANGLLCKPGLRWFAGHALGVLLSKRFLFHRSEALCVYEALEQYLIALVQRLEGQPFVVGASLTLADLALATQLRPLTIVPFFAEHPQLQTLFARHRAMLARYSQEGPSTYQTAIAQARTRRPPVRRRLRSPVQSAAPASGDAMASTAQTFAVNGSLAGNDQQPVWDRAMWAMPWHYLSTLRQRKLRQVMASDAVR